MGPATPNKPPTKAPKKLLNKVLETFRPGDSNSSAAVEMMNAPVKPPTKNVSAPICGVRVLNLARRRLKF